jgi:hypothetical protein
MVMDAERDISSAICGIEVAANCGSITWKDGHRSVLPFVSSPDTHKNLCDAVDIPLIKFMARFPQSTMGSPYVVHQPSTVLGYPRCIDDISDALSRNQCVRIINMPQQQYSNNGAVTTLTTEFLDAVFGISPARKVCIHGTYSAIYIH